MAGRHRVLQPGEIGQCSWSVAVMLFPLPRLLLQVTWCHRVLQPGEAGLTEEEQSLLDRICEAYYLPAWCR